tara:strand:+ start:17050 stop:17304 length:255 start_codon:yes stop_codon:yes gene_type:complete
VNITFIVPEFEVAENKTVVCEVEMNKVDGTHKIDRVVLTDSLANEWNVDNSHVSLALTEDQFIAFFTDGQDVVNNSLEYASEQI